MRDGVLMNKLVLIYGKEFSGAIDVYKSLRKCCPMEKCNFVPVLTTNIKHYSSCDRVFVSDQELANKILSMEVISAADTSKDHNEAIEGKSIDPNKLNFALVTTGMIESFLDVGNFDIATIQITRSPKNKVLKILDFFEKFSYNDIVEVMEKDKYNHDLPKGLHKTEIVFDMEEHFGSYMSLKMACDTIMPYLASWRNLDRDE